MNRLTALALCVVLLGASAYVSAQRTGGRLVYHGRATVEFSSRDIKAVAAYEYSRTNHFLPWIMIELAVLARERIAIDRSQITLMAPGERLIRLPTHEEYRKDHEVLTKLLQNATVSRRPLDFHFTAPDREAIRFFSQPGGTVQNSFVTNQDVVAMGDIFFKTPDGKPWPPGEYLLRIAHPKASAGIPIELK